MDFRYGVEFDYSISTNCAARGCDYICRCSKIEEIEITGVKADCWEVPLHQLNNKDVRRKDPVFISCLERLFSRFGPEDFETTVTWGYYGEEIDCVSLRLEKLELIQEFLKLRDTEKWVEYCLLQEYGYVLEELKDKEWESLVIPISKIKVPVEYRKLDRKTIEKYVNYIKNMKGNSFTIGLLRENNSLIDGYHRYTAALEAGKKKVRVIRIRNEDD